MPDSYRDWYKAHGICPMCKVNNAFYNHVHCEECLEKIALRNIKYKDKQSDYEENRKGKRKQQREERKASGICTVCGSHKAQHGQLCTECWNKRRKRREKEKVSRQRCGDAFRERLAAGVCMYCGEATVQGFCFCEKHLKSRQEAGRKAGTIHSEKWRKEIEAGWNLAKAIHAKKERLKHD